MAGKKGIPKESYSFPEPLVPSRVKEIFRERLPQNLREDPHPVVNRGFNIPPINGIGSYGLRITNEEFGLTREQLMELQAHKALDVFRKKGVSFVFHDKRESKRGPEPHDLTAETLAVDEVEFKNAVSTVHAAFERMVELARSAKRGEN